uniref:Uncharacterized protein n=1 Tax=Arundo donax TaxID=35708 RepID=A0A0A9GG35_ARUDO
MTSSCPAGSSALTFMYNYVQRQESECNLLKSLVWVCGCCDSSVLELYIE